MTGKQSDPSVPRRQAFRRRKIFIHALEYFAAFVGFWLLASGLLILWLVQAGPIHLTFLTDYIEETINGADLGAQIEVEDTILTWAGWRRTLDIHAVNLHVKDNAGRELAILPEMSLGLSTRALIRGQLAPTRIELIRPELTLLRRNNGSFALSTGTVRPETEEHQGDFLPNLWIELLGEPDRSKPTGYLREVGIAQGTVTIIDRKAGVTWRTDHVSVSLDRSSNGVTGALLIESQQFGSPAVIEGSLRYGRGDPGVDLKMKIKNVDLASAGLIQSDLAGMTDTHLILNGSANTRVGLDGKLGPIGMAITGGPGQIVYPDLFSQPIPLKSFSLVAQMDMEQDYVRLETVSMDLNGPVLSVSGVLSGIVSSDDPPQAELAFTARALPAETLFAYWPKGVAQNPKSWINENITAGLIDHVTAEISLQIPRGGDLVLNALNGTFAASGLTVHYLRPLPPIEGGKVQANFDQHQLSGQVLAGQVGENIRLKSGMVRFSGLDEADQFIDVSGQVLSPVQDALTLLDNPRLGYPSKLGIDPKNSSGDADVDLTFAFPALKDLSFDQVKLGAKAKITKGGLKKALFAKDATEGNLDLALDNKGMNIDGPVKLDSIPLDLHWQEYFEPKEGMLRHITTKADATAEQSAGLGFDFRPFLEGESLYDLDYTGFTGGRAQLKADFDLTRATFDLSFLHWQKPAGMEAGASFVMTLLNDIPKTISKFSISTDGFNANGTASFTPDGKNIEDAYFNRMLVGRTDLTNLHYMFRDGGYSIDLGQGILDAEPLMQTRKKKEKEEAADKPQTPYHITATALSGLLMGKKPGERFNNVELDLYHDPLWWDKIRLIADVPSGKKFKFIYGPDADHPVEQHELRVQTDDGGAAIKALALNDSIDGGELEITGHAKHNEAGRPLRAKVKMSSYRLLNQSFLVRFFTVASLTGLVDAATGEGLLFNEASAEFTKTGDRIDLHYLRTAGPSIGLTACGRVDTGQDSIDVGGTIAPAYLLNGILNNIPVIGPLIQGGEGKGAFAFTYNLSGDLNEPKIDVNPLAVLTPGFLRGIFGGDEAGCGDASTKEKSQEKKNIPNPNQGGKN